MAAELEPRYPLFIHIGELIPLPCGNVTQYALLFKVDNISHKSSKVILAPHAFGSRENVTGPCSTYLHESSTISFACFIASFKLFHGASISNSRIPFPKVTCSDTRRFPVACGILACQA